MHEITVVLALILATFTLSSTGLAVLLLRNRQLKANVEFCLSEIAFLESQNEERALQIESLTQKLGDLPKDHTRRRVRTRTTAQKAAFVSYPKLAPNKSSLLDQRNRVIRLAETGQDSSTIAATLGMVPGEVDLIVRLNEDKALVA